MLAHIWPPFRHAERANANSKGTSICPDNLPLSCRHPKLPQQGNGCQVSPACSRTPAITPTAAFPQLHCKLGAHHPKPCCLSCLE